jgi:hypothetical protein
MAHRWWQGCQPYAPAAPCSPVTLFFSASENNFYRRLSELQGLVRPEGLGKFKILPHRVSNPRPPGL